MKFQLSYSSPPIVGGGQMVTVGYWSKIRSNAWRVQIKV